ncbi:tetratricopeptide repeat protein [Frigoriflavimonas asaccharolytica]|uniref:Tetratricopeptide (TPR) repeat protein n=1 Tax=Frigoriflavimonas asaccharolytica TaxID=2735899 RepID=A0A8J8G907_9FLAO|nr:hypothetical protein [Frigoriflavimonas asaccharolytica]NRS93549.1 tetratricopeptide (TPR) repeat protein [Frigoriflavimonas asaccharolytica]
MKKLIFFASIFLPIICFSQFFSTKNDLDQINSLVFSISKNYDQQKDTIQLKNFIGKLASENKVKARIYPIIEQIFVANKNSDLQDQMNRESTRLFEKAIKSSIKLNRQDLIMWTQVNYAFYLYKYREYKNSFPYFLSSIKYLEENPDQDIIQPAKTYIKIGYFSDTIGERENAIKFLKKAQTYTHENAREMANILDNIGNCYWKLNNSKEAEKYYNEAKIIALKSKDELRYAKTLGNIGIIKTSEKKYDEAEKLILKDIEISEKLKSHQNTMFALIHLSNVYLAEKKIDLAEKVLQKANCIAKSKNYFKSSELDIFLQLLEVAKSRKDDSQELALRRKVDTLKLELKNFDGEEAISEINWDTQKEISQFQLAAIKEKGDKEYIQKIAAIVFSLFLIVLIIFIVKFLKNKHKIAKSDFDKKVLTLSLNQLKSEKKLTVSQQTIESYKIYLSEKNEQIENLEHEIEKVTNSTSPYNSVQKGELQKLLESHLMTHENWTNFKTIYINENPEEYHALIKELPDLTDSNLRIIILAQMGMSNNEMSNILGVTVDAVKKAKQRLRKKYSEISI